jgi:dGTPase
VSELPAEAIGVLGTTHSERINTLVNDLVAASDGKAEVQLSQPVFRALDQLRDFLFAEVYMRTAATDEHDRAMKLLRELFAYYLDHPDELPPEYHQVPGDLPTRVADFIAGMTDRYAVRTYEQLFLPRGWLL